MKIRVGYLKLIAFWLVHILRYAFCSNAQQTSKKTPICIVCSFSNEAPLCLTKTFEMSTVVSLRKLDVDKTLRKVICNTVISCDVLRCEQKCIFTLIQSFSEHIIKNRNRYKKHFENFLL